MGTNQVNPFTISGCLKVDDYFKDYDMVMPCFPDGAFASVDEMLTTFDQPDRLEVVGRLSSLPALKLKRPE